MSLPFNIARAGLNYLTAEESTASLPDVAKVYAKMSQQAYKDPSVSHSNGRERMIGGFEYLEDESNQLVGVYYLHDKNLFVFAIKGKESSDTIQLVSFNSIYCKETYIISILLIIQECPDRVIKSITMKPNILPKTLFHRFSAKFIKV